MNDLDLSALLDTLQAVFIGLGVIAVVMLLGALISFLLDG